MESAMPYVDQPASYLDHMVDDLGGLTGEQIEEHNRIAVDLSTRKFMFHVWANLPNTNVGGVMGNLTPYPVLKRMRLLPIYAWSYTDLVDRPIGSGLSIDTSIITGKTQIGSRPVRRTQPVQVSESYIMTMFGKMSGIRTIESLTTTTDEGAREAFMLFHAAMETRRDSEKKDDPRFGLRGVDVLMQDLVDVQDQGEVRQGFLSIAAPVALRYGIRHGLRVPEYLRRTKLFEGVDKYEFQRGVERKGMMMLRELALAANAAVDLATGPNGVLVNTRNQIQAAKIGQPDSKMQKDRLDIWLERQNPDFSWDTEVDRMKAANQPLLDEMRKFGGVGQPVDQTELRELRRQNQELLERLSRLEGVVSAGAGANGGGSQSTEQPATSSKSATGTRGAGRTPAGQS